MKQPIRILLQTTIPTTPDDWSIDRFSLLERYLSSLEDDAGQPLCQIVARVGVASPLENRQADVNGDDLILSTLARSDFDELWLFAVDTGNGISDRDCQGITGFRQRGGGILTTRDHMDLGSSLCNLAGVGLAHFFHTKNPVIVAFERERDELGNLLGRAVAQSTFHHFCDYNWDTDMGCPSFVDEPPGNTMQTEPQAISDLQAYLRNLVHWLSPVQASEQGDFKRLPIPDR